MYSHDNDLASWFVKDVVDNHHLRLIGQETSTRGIFIGPLYYYLLIPFYFIFGMDPAGGVVMITLLGIFSIWSVYFVFKNVFGKKDALIATFLYAVSFYTVFNDREVVPTMPVITWSVWSLYGLDLLLKGKQRKGFLVLGILAGLIWHLNMALVLIMPLIPVTLWLSKKKIKVNNLRDGVVAATILSLPLILFELRHNFSQTHWFVESLTTNQHAVVSGYDQFRRMIHLMSKNIDGFLWGSIDYISYEITAFLLLILAAFLFYKEVIKKRYLIIFSLWIVLYIGFFSVYSKNLSEYYLNGSLLPWIYVVTEGVSYTLAKENLKFFGYLALFVFFAANIHRIFSIEENKSGYLYRKAIVAEIDANSKKNNYPCVSVSYITEPGYEFGYRYFFYLKGMHVNHPDSESPVYTIVYPLRNDIKVDQVFGHIGLIYPNYSVYNIEGVIESCSGENSNLTDPMWGLTQ